SVLLDDRDPLLRIRAADEVDRLADDVVERDQRAILAALAGEVEQAADDLLDLEARAVDQLGALVRLRARLELLEQELGEGEDGEQRVVDLVGDTRRELPDRSQLPALGK